MFYTNAKLFVNTTGLCLLLSACISTEKTVPSQPNEASRREALLLLNNAIKPLKAKVTTSTEIDWHAGTLPWDRFTLPTISPNGLHVAVQLGQAPSMACLSGNENTPIESTSIELHILDPERGRKITPFHIGREGLILTRAVNDQIVLVESPQGDGGRWIGSIDWTTGNLGWIVADENINAFPTINAYGDFAWSRKSMDEDRFHLVIDTTRGQRIVDDGESDWLMPTFLSNNRLRIFNIKDGALRLIELDLHARDPLLTAMILPLIPKGATRELVWHIATTNPTSYWHDTQAFYHPEKHRMVIWRPGHSFETKELIEGSIAAAPTSDGSWLVAVEDRVVRQDEGDTDGVHIRNSFAIPIATTSNKWTHLMLVPQGNRLQVRAVNLDR